MRPTRTNVCALGAAALVALSAAAAPEVGGAATDGEVQLIAPEDGALAAPGPRPPTFQWRLVGSAASGKASMSVVWNCDPTFKAGPYGSRTRRVADVASAPETGFALPRAQWRRLVRAARRHGPVYWYVSIRWRALVGTPGHWTWGPFGSFWVPDYYWHEPRWLTSETRRLVPP